MTDETDPAALPARHRTRWCRLLWPGERAVSALLDAGYELHSSPAITADPGARSPLHRLDHSVRRRWAVARDGSSTVPEYCSYSRAAAWSPQPRDIFDEAL